MTATLSATEVDFVLRVLRATAAWPNQTSREDLWWRCDGEYAPVTFLINCSDIFFWGCADAERLTPENIEIFEQAHLDTKALMKHGDIWAPTLFCARVRKERPQGAAYPLDAKELWSLFDECGPVREIGLGNPYLPGRTPLSVEQAKEAPGTPVKPG